MKAFEIKVLWKPDPPAADPVKASFCHLKIKIADKNITEFQGEHGRLEDHLELPAYFLAEWIAENWWALLWEPRKDDEDFYDDEEFMGRHSLSASEHGFILPAITIIPAGGDLIGLNVRNRSAEFVTARFNGYPPTSVPRSIIEGELSRFVNETIDSLRQAPNTALNDIWKLVQNTTPEEKSFCHLMGALGLSPYDAHPSIERALDAVSQLLSTDQLLDLCLTSTAGNIVLAAAVAAHSQAVLDSAAPIDLSVFYEIQPVTDNQSVPAWRTGHLAAKKIREHFTISPRDIDGAKEIFEKLLLDKAIEEKHALSSNKSPVTGVTKREKDQGKLSIVQGGHSSRRFSGARAAYFLWTGGEKDQRLITSAVTRDQQASRAFAAELLVPQDLLRTSASNQALTRDQIDEIAQLASVSTDVIRFQAQNMGLQIIGERPRAFS